MSYKEKLEEFNSTDKYKSELDFLYKLLGSNYSKVLDYGCGNLYAVRYFNQLNKSFFGYDIEDYNCRGKYADKLGRYDIVYFMHSIAHIEYIDLLLRNLDTKEVCVITPNREWLDLQDKTNYKSDDTVISHYSLYELEVLFQSAGYNIEDSGQFGVDTRGQGERLFLRASKNE